MGYIGHFSLWGDFEAEEVTEALQITPSSIIAKGETLEGAEGIAQVTTWDLHCPSDISPNEQVEFLLASLTPKAEALRPFAQQFTAEFNIADTGGVLNLPAGIIQALANLNAALNCFCLEDAAQDGN